MAYLDNFDFDIFISYSHIDNERTSGQAMGWIEQFYNDLTVSLWQSIGTKDVKIWWDDKRLDGGVMFDDAIADGIKKSAILLCLNSPAYLKSKYCRKEMELFTSHAQSQPLGLKVGKHSRLFNVLLYNLPFTTWPGELSGTTGFPFHDAEDKESRGHPLDLRTPQFRQQLQDLTDSLVTLMEEFPKRGEEVKEDDTFTIFFGDVPDSLRTIRKRTITELQKSGYRIISDVPPPYEADEHEDVVNDKIGQSDLLVNLFDQFPGREVDGDEVTWYPQKQGEICLSSEKPQLIWVPADLDVAEIEEESYKAFISRVEEGSHPKQIDFIRGIKSELPGQIIGMAEQIKQKAKRPASGSKVSVLLDTHYNDQLYALELCKNLLENDIQPFINPQEDDPRKNINILEDRISQVNNLVFFYGKVSGEWVSERMKAARQYIVSNDYPIEQFYVYMLPPRKDSDDKMLQQRFIKVKVLNNSDKASLDSLTLNQFLQNIKAAV